MSYTDQVGHANDGKCKETDKKESDAEHGGDKSEDGMSPADQGRMVPGESQPQRETATKGKQWSHGEVLSALKI